MTREILTVLMLAAATNLAAATDAKPRHGGRAVGAGNYHIELVSRANVVEIHLTDHDDKAVSSAGYKGVAILTIDGKSQRIVLAPGGASQLTGKAAGNIQGAPKGVVQITPPNGKTVQASFD